MPPRSIPAKENDQIHFQLRVRPILMHIQFYVTPPLHSPQVIAFLAIINLKTLFVLPVVSKADYTHVCFQCPTDVDNILNALSEDVNFCKILNIIPFHKGESEGLSA
jgi:hypothetical protein